MIGEARKSAKKGRTEGPPDRRLQDNVHIDSFSFDYRSVFSI